MELEAISQEATGCRAATSLRLGLAGREGDEVPTSSSILGKLMLVERLRSSQLGFQISRLPGLVGLRFLDTRAGSKKQMGSSIQEAAAASGGETISLSLHEWQCLFQMDFHSNVKASRPG